MMTSLALALVLTSAIVATQIPAPEAALFDARLAEYVALRDEIRALVRLPFERDDEWSVFVRRRRLGEALRAERENVTAGNVFDRFVGRWFGAVCAEAMRSDMFRRWLRDRDRYPRLHVEVNQPYPLLGEHDVPIMLLQLLPELPPGIEYRVVGDSLVLWDEEADVVIDVLRDAFATRTTDE